MPSLYDRLKGISPQKEPKKPLASSCGILVRSERFPLCGWDGQPVAGAELRLLANCAFEDSYKPTSFLFLDTETTGLSTGVGTVAFLIGMGRMEGGQLHVTQVLMRDYDQEGEILAVLLASVLETACLVTYNGSGFDLPLLTTRLTMHRMGVGFADMAHIDLLHAARRVFKLRLGRCPLSRIEEEVFGERRVNDLPGAEVPRRYFSYLDSGDETLLETVLDHNRQDIVSLARLFITMLELMKSPLSAPHQEDMFSIGKALEKRGQPGRAEVCYRACTDAHLLTQARMRLADMCRRERRDGEAVQLLEALRGSAHVNERVFITLSKLYEHRLHMPARALDIARAGMVYCSERLGTASFNSDAYQDLLRRARRLTGKAEKTQDDNKRQAQGQDSPA